MPAVPEGKAVEQHSSLAVPPSLATSRPVSPAAEALVSPEWQQLLSAWLGAHHTYPHEASRRREEGNVVLRFTANRSGRVSDIAVVRTTGYAILDQAAEAVLQDATLPAFTTGMSQDHVTITVQIRYALKD